MSSHRSTQRRSVISPKSKYGPVPHEHLGLEMGLERDLSVRRKRDHLRSADSEMFVRITRVGGPSQHSAWDGGVQSGPQLAHRRRDLTVARSGLARRLPRNAEEAWSEHHSYQRPLADRPDWWPADRFHVQQDAVIALRRDAGSAALGPVLHSRGVVHAGVLLHPPLVVLADGAVDT